MYILGSFEGKRGKSYGTVLDLMNSLKLPSTVNIVVLEFAQILLVLSAVRLQSVIHGVLNARGKQRVEKVPLAFFGACGSTSTECWKGEGGIGPQFVIISVWVGLFFRVGIEFHPFPLVCPLDCLRYVIGIFFGHKHSCAEVLRYRWYTRGRDRSCYNTPLNNHGFWVSRVIRLVMAWFTKGKLAGVNL